jgi:UDP-N-acetylmuramate dehydrogenase
MNAGGHGSSMANHLRSVRVADLAHLPGRPLVTERLTAELCFRYRRSAIAPTDVVLDATFDLASGPPERGRVAMREIVRWRRAHQPGGQNAGSVFTNPEASSPQGPPPGSAGRLIEETGLKGFRHGTATVSPKHANFIQAEPGGSADDVAQLIAIVASKVAERFGIQLKTEVRMIGYPSGMADSEQEVYP